MTDERLAKLIDERTEVFLSTKMKVSNPSEKDIAFAQKCVEDTLKIEIANEVYAKSTQPDKAAYESDIKAMALLAVADSLHRIQYGIVIDREW